MTDSRRREGASRAAIGALAVLALTMTDNARAGDGETPSDALQGFVRAPGGTGPAWKRSTSGHSTREYRFTDWKLSLPAGAPDFADEHVRGILDDGTLVGDAFFGGGRAEDLRAWELKDGKFVTYARAAQQIGGRNARGDSVGSRSVPGRQAGTTAAWRRSRDGAMTTLKAPGAASTFALAISADGVVCGWFQTSTAVGGKGFLCDGGSFRVVEYPGATTTQITGVNSSGRCSANVVTAEGMRAASYSEAGEFAFLTVPPSTASWACGINDRGDICGAYTMAMAPGETAQTRGFIQWRSGNVDTIDFGNWRAPPSANIEVGGVPRRCTLNARSDSQILSINAHGDVVVLNTLVYRAPDSDATRTVSRYFVGAHTRE